MEGEGRLGEGMGQENPFPYKVLNTPLILTTLIAVIIPGITCRSTAARNCSAFHRRELTTEHRHAAQRRTRPTTTTPADRCAKMVCIGWSKNRIPTLFVE